MLGAGESRHCSRCVGMDSQPEVSRKAYERGCFITQTNLAPDMPKGAE